MLPRIPKASSAEDFTAFANAGRQLSELHINYETVKPYPLEETVKTESDDPWAKYRVGDKKMRFTNKETRDTLIYNHNLTLSGVPEEAFRYQLGPRSALEWVMDRYVITTDKASGIVNDPNAWCEQENDPRYVVDLIGRVITVSLETMKIVDGLPQLDLT